MIRLLTRLAVAAAIAAAATAAALAAWHLLLAAGGEGAFSPLELAAAWNWPPPAPGRAWPGPACAC
jgi:hypothetical protein